MISGIFMPVCPFFKKDDKEKLKLFKKRLPTPKDFTNLMTD
jgi:hypothetical protein